MADNRKYISIINKEGNDIYIKDVEARQSIANKADNTTFGGSGSGHSSGLVPDPGATQGNTKFLREDGTWQIPLGGIAYESKSAESGGVEVSLVTTGEKYIWNNKQDIISDLSTIRNGASAGATAYQKPSAGIPASDIESGVIPTTLPASDVSVWAKAANKPSYAYSEIGYAVSATTSAGGTLSLDGTVPLHIVTLTGNVSALALSTNPAAGHSCHVVLTAASDCTVAIAHDVTNRVCPKAEDVSLSIPAGGYVEIDFLTADSKVYVRGI